MNADDGSERGDAATVRLRRLGSYTLTEQVGEGGMGVVHRALDGSGRVVAVKVLRPHVAEVLDAEVDSAAPYLVTRFVSGPSLYQVVDQSGPMHGDDLTDLARDLADALCSVHRAGVVHRDLKPGNVLMHDGEPVVIDFGIAQIADETRLTVPGMVFGTPGYLAPELLAGGAVTPAADVYAWAATLVYAATARPPYDRGRFEAIAYAVLNEEPDLSGVPRDLAPLLGWCLAKDPESRPGAEELRRRLEDRDLPGEAPPAATSVLPAAEPAVDDREDEYGGYGRDADGYPEDEYPDDGTESPAAYEDEYAYPAEPTFPGRRHPFVTVVLFGLAAALGAVVPLAAGIGLVGWLVVARTIDRSGLFVERRRALRGRRRSDGFAAAGALPWHGFIALLVTVLTLAVTLIGAGLLLGVGILGANAADLPLDLRIIGAVAALLVALLSWGGLDGRSVRQGGRRLLARVLRPRWLAIAVTVVLVVAIGVLAARAGSDSEQIWPLVDGSQVTDWLLDGLLEIGVRL